MSTCRLPYPDGPSGCIWLLLPHSYKPSPMSERLGIRISARRFPTRFVFRGCKVRLMLRPADLLAPHRPGLLHSSFHLQSRLFEMSNMTTRVYSQFPRPDLHRQHAQHCGLRRTQTELPKAVESFCGPACARSFFPVCVRLQNVKAVQGAGDFLEMQGGSPASHGQRSLRRLRSSGQALSSLRDSG